MFRTKVAVLPVVAMMVLGSGGVTVAKPVGHGTARPAVVWHGRQGHVPDFGAQAAASADVAVNGWGDQAGYHIEVARGVGDFAWRQVALLRPGGLDDRSWTGYQCVSGDGRYAAVTVLPISAVNLTAAQWTPSQRHRVEPNGNR